MRMETLQAIGRQIRAEIEEINESLERWRTQEFDDGCPSGVPPNSGNMGSGAWERRLRARMTDLLFALERLDDDDFGTCEDCGREIPIARLLAVPTATRCVGCMEVCERRGHADLQAAY